MRIGIFFAPVALLFAARAVAQDADGEPLRIFFDWGKPQLTRDAEAILGEALADYQRTPGSRVEIAGHADRSGPTAHNIGASRRRADAARDWMVERGIPASVITVAAFGESRPIIPTEDGVREAQNRRVEIRILPRN
jgi:outer membrane protein OmpA-like peptidoglycan-associated protein